MLYSNYIYDTAMSSGWNIFKCELVIRKVTFSPINAMLELLLTHEVKNT